MSQAGIRLHHPTVHAPTGKTLVFVVELDKPFASGTFRHCNLCSRTHANKSIHLRVDEHGDTIVSKAIYEQLKTRFLAGFEMANEVTGPRVDKVGAVAQRGLQIVQHKLNADQNGDPTNTPERNKYESGEIVERSLRSSLRKLFFGDEERTDG